MEDDGSEEAAEKVSYLVGSRNLLPTGFSGHAEHTVFAVGRHEKDEVFLDVESALAPAESVEERALQEEEERFREDIGLEEETDPDGSGTSESPDERNRRTGVPGEVLASITMARQCLMEIAEQWRSGPGGDDVDSRPRDERGVLLWEARRVRELGNAVKAALAEREERRKRERKQLENSILCLTEENRDVSEMLRAALSEKRGQGPGGAAKKGAILQIAERGWQKVGSGIGFVVGQVGSLGGDTPSGNPGNPDKSPKSDDGDAEEENERTSSLDRLEDKVEMITNNLRADIANLRKALEESRSDSEHLQSLVVKQGREIDENKLRMKVLEERESLLNQNVLDLGMKIKETEEEMLRWREACELEVEAGNAAIQEHERKSAILREDLRRTKAALDDANRRLMVKEKLVATAMVAQATAEASLQMADGRSVGLRERIEELTKQLEDEAERGRRQRGGGQWKLRHVCWPWHALRIIDPSISIDQGGPHPGRGIPEMMALLP